MKCGTTSLWEYLEKHPSILHVKDQHHFFPDEYNKEIETQIDHINNKVTLILQENEIYPPPFLRKKKGFFFVDLFGVNLF
jgi:hypothetical protein